MEKNLCKQPDEYAIDKDILDHIDWASCPIGTKFFVGDRWVQIVPRDNTSCGSTPTGEICEVYHVLRNCSSFACLSTDRSDGCRVALLFCDAPKVGDLVLHVSRRVVPKRWEDS